MGGAARVGSKLAEGSRTTNSQTVLTERDSREILDLFCAVPTRKGTRSVRTLTAGIVISVDKKEEHESGDEDTILTDSSVVERDYATTEHGYVRILCVGCCRYNCFS